MLSLAIARLPECRALGCPRFHAFAANDGSPCGSALGRRCALLRGTCTRPLCHAALPSSPGSGCVARRTAALGNAAKQLTVRVSGGYGPAKPSLAISRPLGAVVQKMRACQSPAGTRRSRIPRLARERPAARGRGFRGWGRSSSSHRVVVRGPAGG